MEPSHQTGKLVGRILLVTLLVMVALAYWEQQTSPLLQTLTSRTEGPVRIMVQTDPAMRFAYDPVTRKTLITLAPCALTGESSCFNGEYDRFFIPKETQQEIVWEQLKTDLSSWRFNPTPLWTYVRSYVNARVQKRTNITLAEFIRLSLELPSLTATDFAVEHPATKKSSHKKAGKETTLKKDIPADISITASSNKPLKVIILNASGKQGLAESLKQYLRAQYAKGLLQVDVYDTGNYSSLQDSSFIIDHSGKLVQVTQISRAIGITSEIQFEKSPNDIYDCRIILGKDFKMPL